MSKLLTRKQCSLSFLELGTLQGRMFLSSLVRSIFAIIWLLVSVSGFVLTWEPVQILVVFSFVNVVCE
jgi:hypothetical protein